VATEEALDRLYRQDAGAILGKHEELARHRWLAQDTAARAELAVAREVVALAGKVVLNQKKVRCPTCRVRRDGACVNTFPCPYKMLSIALAKLEAQP
jgi:hypothetical protein